MPLRLLVVADFLGRRLGIGETGQTKTTRIDKDSFKGALERLAPRLLFEVTNHLGGQDKTLTVDLTIRALEDFGPEAVVSTQEDCAALLAVRRKLTALAQAGNAPGQIAAQLEPDVSARPAWRPLLDLLGGSPPPATPKAATEPSDSPEGGSLLDQLADATEENHVDASGALDAAIGAIAGGGKKKPARGALDPALAWIDQRLGRQVDEILHDPLWMSVEEAWRGLRMLVERTDFRRGIAIDILPAAGDDLRPILIEGALDVEYNQPGDPPLGAVIVDHAFDRTARDMTLIQELAQKGESLQTPIVAQVNAAFFGLDAVGPMGGGGSLHDLLSDPQFAKWMGVRQSEQARWIALCMNRILLRQPWGGEDAPVKAFDYREARDEEKGEGLLWGGAVWAMATCIAGSQAREGWPIFISGAREGGVVEDLILRRWEARPGAVATIPLETGLSDLHTQDLATAGLVPLQCAANRDQAYFTYVPTAHAPKRYGDAGATQDAALKAILPYQLYAGRIAQWLNRLIWEGSAGASDEELAGRLKRQTLDLLTTGKGPAPEECVEITVADSPDNPMRRLVTFEIKPPFKLFNATPRLELTVEMAK